MKTLLITHIGLLLSLNLFAQGRTQGYVDFRNTGALTDTRQRIYVGTYGGGSANYAPGGRYSVALYWAPDGTTDESQFIMVGNSAPVLSGGLFTGGNRSVPTTTGNVMFQLRGWTTAY